MEARASRGLFALGIVGSASALGAIHTPVLLVTAAVFGASAFFGWRSEKPFRVRSVATLLVGLAVALTVYTALQAVPLPRGAVAALSPYAAEVWERSLRPLGLPGPAWITLSLDPVATRIEVLRGATYLACLLAALPIARSREGTAFLERLLVGSVLFVGVAAIVHPLLGAERVFGVYQPVEGSFGRHIAPLLNPNNLAAYVNVGLCVALGIAAATEPQASAQRWVAAGIALFFVALQMWIASRGGVASMLLGVVLVAVLAVRTRAHGSATTGLLVAVLAAVVAASFGILVVGGSDEAWTELADRDVSKLQIFGHAMRMVARAPIFGVGRGAFASSFPAFRSDDAGNVTFREPENILAQWPCEWGVPVAIGALVTFAVVFRPSTPLARSRPPVGAWAALLCLFVHNLVDFDSEVPGVVVALVTAGALVVGGSAGHRERFRFRRWSRRPRLVAAASVAIPAAAALLVLPAVGHDLDADELRLHQRVLASPHDREGIRAEIAAAMRRHPAEPYFPYLGGLRALVAHDESPLPWLAASVDRASLYGRAHLLLARWIWTHSPAQARLEYRLAYQQDASLAAPAAAEGARLVQTYEDARELAPGDGEQEANVLASLAASLGPRLPATAARLDADLAATGGRFSAASTPSLVREAQAAVEYLEDDSATWCADGRDACVARATAALARLRAQSPDRCRTDALQAQLQLATGQNAPALETLEKAVRSDHDGLECVDSMVNLAERQSTDGHADALLERLASLACSSGSACVETLSALSRAEEAHGRPRRALTFAKRAYERDSSDASLVTVARLAASTGLHAEALEDYRRLAQRHPESPEWPKAIDAERVGAYRELPTMNKVPATATAP